MREGLVDARSRQQHKRHEEGGSRERVLTSGELRAIWTATAGGDQYSAVVRLLLSWLAGAMKSAPSGGPRSTSTRR